MKLYLSFAYLNFVLLCIYVIGLELFIPFEFIQYTDEILLIISLFSIFFQFGNKHTKFKLCFFIYLVYCVFNYFISPFSNSFVMMFMQSIITLKVIIVTFAISVNYRNLKSIELRNRIYKRVRIVAFFFSLLLFVTLILNFVLGEIWMNMWNLPILYRHNIIRVFCFFRNGGAVGYFIAFIVPVLYYLNHERKFMFSNVLMLLFIVFILAIVTSYRKLLLIALPLIIFYVQQANIPLKKKVVIYLLPVIFILGLYQSLGDSYFEETYSDISNFATADSSYLRGLLFYNGFVLAGMMFPVGTGAATFGTVYSQFNTLKAYEEVGMEHWVLNINGDGAAIYDNYFGSLIAEYGFGGFCIIVILFSLLYKSIARQLPYSRLFIFNITFFYLLLSSFSGSLLSAAEGVMIYSMTILLILGRYEDISNFQYVSNR